MVDDFTATTGSFGVSTLEHTKQMKNNAIIVHVSEVEVAAAAAAAPCCVCDEV